jgi:hypothetical protein
MPPVPPEFLAGGLVVAIGLGIFLLGHWQGSRVKTRLVAADRRVVAAGWSAPTTSGTEHVHRYDTMLADGKGWRCGICGEPRGES